MSEPLPGEDLPEDIVEEEEIEIHDLLLEVLYEIQEEVAELRKDIGRIKSGSF